MKQTLLVLFLLIWASLAWGADICIRDGGSGDGSAWNNALDDLPATLTRGNTYWIADGTYAAYTFNDAVSGDTKIYIKKATVAAHGVATGWDNAYGDGQAVWSSNGSTWQITTNNWEFDGVSCSGDTSGYGFKVVSTVSGSNCNTIYIHGPSSWTTAVPDTITFKYIEIQSPGMLTGTGDKGLYVSPSLDAGGECRELTVSYCYFHDSSQNHLLLRNNRQVTVNNSIFNRNWSSVPFHGESISSASSDSVTIKYCKFIDCSGTGVIVPENNTADNDDYWWIYGNLFYTSYGNPFDLDGTSNGIIATSSNVGNKINYIEVYNNTIVNMSYGINCGFTFHEGIENKIYNNLWFNCANYATMPSAVEGWHGYNQFVRTTCPTINDTELYVADSTGVFTDHLNLDFSLAAATALACSTLSSPFNVDLNDSTRGGDGYWDAGYLEYSGDLIPPSTTHTYYVHPDGGGAGTEASPFATIAAAEAAADQNDIIIIDGTLNEKLTTPSDSVTYRGRYNATPPRIGGKKAISGFVTTAATVTDSITTPLQDGLYNIPTRNMSTAGTQEIMGYTNSGQIANGWFCFLVPALTNFSSWNSFKVRLFSLSNTGIPVLRIKTAKGYLKYTTQDTTRYKAMQVESASRDSILWNNTDPAVNTWYFAPELASILPSLAENDTLTVLFNNESSTNDTRINVEMTENANSNQARIYYQYSTTGGGVPFYLVPAANRSFTRVWKAGVALTQAATHAALEAGKFYRSATGDSLFVVAADTTGIEIDGLGATVDMNGKNGVTVRNIVVNGIGSGGPVVKLSGNNGLVAHVFIDSAKVGIYAYGDSNRVLNSVFAFEDTAKTDTGDDNEFDYNATLTGSKTLGGAHDITLASYDPDNPPEAVRDKGYDLSLPFTGDAPDLGPNELAALQGAVQTRNPWTIFPNEIDNTIHNEVRNW